MRLSVLSSGSSGNATYMETDSGGLLVDAIRQPPYSVLLLDEIEKAHPDIYNILLQVMDHATLTDNTGRASYRIDRYLRDSAGTGAWRVAATPRTGAGPRRLCTGSRLNTPCRPKSVSTTASSPAPIPAPTKGVSVRGSTASR